MTSLRQREDFKFHYFLWKNELECSFQTPKLAFFISPLCRKTHARVNPSPRRQLQEAEPHVTKRLSSQAHHPATLAKLFSGLQEAVLSQSGSSASKVTVSLCSAVIRRLTFLLTTESFSLEDGNPSGLEEVREEYPAFKRYSLSVHCRYLYFYKHTVDLLIEHGIVCTEEVHLPEVSTAISHLWQELSEERRDSILQYCSQRDFLMDPKAACTEGSVRDSRGNSEEASDSSVCTPEIMFEDAFDVAAGFLDRSETQGVSSQSSAFASCTYENPKDHQMLYLQITDFLKNLFFANTQFCQVSFAKGFLIETACFCHCQKRISVFCAFDHIVQNHDK
uniref:Stimulated by retinoic acid 8 n=1 Tax=Amazona collaria TaxID=241587 RepID=A0A8B9EXA5_9PSIT